MEECNQNGHNNTQKWPKEKASAIFFSFFDYQNNSKYIPAKFCEKNVEQFTRSRNIFPKLLPNILKMTCSKGQHPTFFFRSSDCQNIIKKEYLCKMS